MSTKVIPETIHVICDCCNTECLKSNFKHNGNLFLRRAGLDYGGIPVADDSINIDVCDRCNDSLRELIFSFMKSKK